MIFVNDFLKDQQVLSSPTRPKHPTVSVIMPTYSRCKGGLLERAINSVLAQSYKDFEFIVMDDGSTDGSFDLIEGYRAMDVRVIHVRHELNSGLPGLRCNEGIEIASGKYLAFQFDDDVWRPNALNDLVFEADKHSEPTLIIGKAKFNMKVGKDTLPKVDLNQITLYESNRFANNSVLIPRTLVDQFGMYDPHISMRRLCDWDLWLRLIKYVPFVQIENCISDIFESNPGSIALTVPYDIPLFRYINSIQRNELLTPENWHDYPVDSLTIAGVDITKDFRRRIYEEHLVPYYFKMRHKFPNVEGFVPTTVPDRPKTLLYTKQTYEIGNDILMTNFDVLLNQRGSYKSYYRVLNEIEPSWVNETDLLLLMRTVEDEARPLLDTALEKGIPVCMCLDDDLLTFYEFGPKFNYLAPGTPYYQNLTYVLERSDAVVVTNSYIRQSVEAYNHRTVPDNGSIPREYLPDSIPPRDPRQPLRIGYVGSGYRIEEFKLIWDALLRISQEYGDRLAFEFWGLDVSSLPPLSSPVSMKKFTFSYYYYLRALNQAGIDILLTPMLDYPRPRLGKARIKYYETAVGGALGIFSDVPQYAQLPADLTCLKAKNTADDWYKAIKRAIQMPPDEFERMRSRCLAHVRDEFTVEAQVQQHEAALRAVEFHGHTRNFRHEDGRPRVAYVFHSAYMGGGEIQLWRRLYWARTYGIEPIVVLPIATRETSQGIQLREKLEHEAIQVEFLPYSCFTEPRTPQMYSDDLEKNAVREFIKRARPALVHTVTFNPSFGQVCRELEIPHVATLYQVDEAFIWPENTPAFEHSSVVQSDSMRFATRWSNLLGNPNKFCSRGMAPEELFELGQRRFISGIGLRQANEDREPPRLVVFGTFQERKRQLETIEALGLLKKAGLKFDLTFYGYTHFYPAYMEKCNQAIQKWGLADNVFIHEFTDDLVSALQHADILLSLSTNESSPTAVSDAFAAGVLVVATPVGGVTEIVIDQVSGILCKDTQTEALAEGIRTAIDLPPEKRLKIVEQARRVARSECHYFRIMNDLFTVYNLAMDHNNKKAPAHSEIVMLPSVNLDSRTSDALRAPAAPPGGVVQLSRGGLVYDFHAKDSNWNGLDVMLGTHLKPASGKVVLQVETLSGVIVRTVALDLREARDNEWIKFRFPVLRNSKNQHFKLKFFLQNPDASTQVSVYQGPTSTASYVRTQRRIARILGIQQKGGQLYCREWYGH
jgi:O-antigen biosynthesis protein